MSIMPSVSISAAKPAKNNNATRVTEQIIDKDTTWGPNRTYLIEEKLEIASGKTLTIKEGTTILMGQGAYIQVNDGSRLDAWGLLDSKVVFRPDDYSVSTKGYWQGIIYKDGSKGYFEHVELLYGGMGNEEEGAAIKVDSQAKIMIVESTLKGNGNLNSNGVSFGSALSVKGTAILDNVVFEENSTAMRTDGEHAIISWSDITFNNNKRAGYLNFNSALSSSGKQTVVNSNKDEGIQIYESRISVSGNLANIGEIPYVVNVKDTVIPSGVSVKVLEGASMLMGEGASITVNGQLEVLGTADDPILIKGNSTMARKGFWKGIIYSQGGTGTIEYARIMHGGKLDTSGTKTGGAVTVSSNSSVKLDNIYFEENGEESQTKDESGSALWVEGNGKAEIVYSMFKNNAIALKTSGTDAVITWSNNTFNGNRLIGVVNTTSTLSTNGKSTITNSGGSGGLIIYGGVFASSGSLKELGGLPYIIKGEITIKKDSVINVEKGVTLEMETGSEIIVDGEFNIQGTPQKPVYIKKASGMDENSLWKSIFYRDQSKGEITNARISGGGMWSEKTLSWGGPFAFGGAVNVSADASVTISNVLFQNNGQKNADADKMTGGLWVFHNGSATVRNCVFYNNTTGIIVNNPYLNSATLKNIMVTDSIFWKNEKDQVGLKLEDVWFCDIKEFANQNGNIYADPLFADPEKGIFTLKSTSGRWSSVENDSEGEWVVDNVHSPCIDSGRPNSEYLMEPEPNGHAVDMGIYGNTCYASKSTRKTESKLYSLETKVTGSGSVENLPYHPGENTFESGLSMTLYAIADDGWEFDHWEGSIESRENPVTFTMNGDKNITAVFVQKKYKLNVSVIPENSGTVLVEVNREGIWERVQNLESEFVCDDNVRITVIPAESYAFERFTGSNYDFRKTQEESTYSFSMGTEDRNVNAVFTLDYNNNLNFDTPLKGSVPEYGWRNYTLTVPEVMKGKNIAIRINAGSDDKSLRVYGKYGQVPSSSDYDYCSTGITARGIYELVIWDAKPGKYYIGVQGAFAGDAEKNYRIETVLLYSNKYIADFMPRCGANKGELTLRVKGNNFTEGMTFLLANSTSDEIKSNNVWIISTEEAWVTFDLQGQLADYYDLFGIWPSGEIAELFNSFEIIPDDGKNNESMVEARIIAPDVVRAGRNYTIWIEYTNKGMNDIKAPIFVLSSSSGALLKLTEEEPFEENFVEVLGISFDGPAGILPPGSTYRIPVYMQGIQMKEMKFELDIVDDNMAIDWSKIEGKITGGNISQEGKKVIINSMKDNIGDTVLSYSNALCTGASYLSSIGRRVWDTRELLEFEIWNLLQPSPYRYIEETTDTYEDTFGLPLEFVRAFPLSLDDRYTKGSIGMGWTHNYDIKLDAETNQSIIVRGPLGAKRTFEKQRDGSYICIGEQKTVIKLSGERYQLFETDGKVLSFGKDGYLESIEDNNGNKLDLIYKYTADNKDKLLTEIRHNSGSFIKLEYEGSNIKRVIDSKGNMTEYSYDETGNYLISVKNEEGYTVQYGYNKGGFSSEKASGEKVSDEKNSEKSSSEKNINEKNSNKKNNNEKNITMKADSGSEIQYEYFGLSEVIYPDGSKSEYSYDRKGRLTKISTGSGLLTESYSYQAGCVSIQKGDDSPYKIYRDENGHVVRIVNPLGRSQSAEYDSRGNIIKLTGYDGSTYEYEYNGKGNLIGEKRPDGFWTKMLYDSETDYLLQVIDPTGTKLLYEYDDRGNIIKTTYADGKSVSWVYDENGRPVKRTDKKNRTANYTYNSEGKVSRVDYSDGSWVEYGYNELGKVTEIANKDGKISMKYDSRGLLTRIDYPSGDYFEYTYDSIGYLATSRDKDGFMLYYSYDKAGRLTKIAGITGGIIVDYKYDKAGRIVKETYGNGICNEYTYNAMGQLKSIRTSNSVNETVSLVEYEYDNAGRLYSEKTDQMLKHYIYDSEGKLIKVGYSDGTIYNFSYDANGNRTGYEEKGILTKYEANNLNQYTMSGIKLYEYDSEGNLAESSQNKEDTTVESLMTFEYDVENRLYKVSSLFDARLYKYDAAGNRTVASYGEQETRRVYDPLTGMLAAEYDKEGKLIAKYVCGNSPVMMLDGNGKKYYYTFDAIGNTSFITDSSGKIANWYQYSPFGVVVNKDETVYNSFTFKGRFGVEAEPNGLYFVKNRVYNPILGRYINIDSRLPLNEINPLDELNPYVFEGNDPINVKEEAGIDIKTMKLSLAANTLNYRGLFENINENASKKRLATKTITGEWEWNSIEQTGPMDKGREKLVKPGEQLIYTLYFENPEGSQTAIKEAVLVNKLSPMVDWSSFKPVEIVLGNKVIPILSDKNGYFAQVIVDDTVDGIIKSYRVDISVELNLKNGEARWVFSTIDFETGKTPVDDLAGFLAPNTKTGVGEAHVVFSVDARDDLKNNDIVENNAIITFDGKTEKVFNVAKNTVWVEKNKNNAVLLAASTFALLTAAGIIIFVLVRRKKAKTV